MKIILSRKGFDSANGGYASPILQDRRLISLPIPSKRPQDSMRYSDLKINGLKSEINNYYDLMTELGHKNDKGIPQIKYNQKWVDLTEQTMCHLDPDIRKEVLDDREKDWMAIFGQCDNAQSHLANKKNDVKENDLFLFFGRFREMKDKEFGFDKDMEKCDLHIIFGYLHVGKKIDINNATQKEKDWLRKQKHPHIEYPNKRNTVYVASECLCLNGHTFPGYGVLNFSEKGVLTDRKGPEPSCSKWKLFSFSNETEITYHPKPWKEEEYFQSASIGQEFVIDAKDEKVKEWAKKIICAGRTQKS